MMILFVCSGNAKEGISPIIYNQGKSLINQGISVDFFTIKGRRFYSYFSHIFILRRYLKKNNYDIIHAHYSFSSYVASLSGAKPLVVSLMGSDVLTKQYLKIIILIFNKLFFNKIIVKSLEMSQRIGSKNIEIIPNGVVIEKFTVHDKKSCREKLKWADGKLHVLFDADPSRSEKNFSLLQRAIDLITSDYEIVLHFLKNIPNDKIPIYINASDIMVLSSLYEGSPNIIKEAMACNCPIVATDVGDIKWIFGDTDGCYLTSFDAEDVVEKLKKSIEFVRTKGRTNGRQRIIELGLDSVTVARKLIAVYNKVLNLESAI